MSSFSVKTRVGLNGLGKAGAALFIGGPVIGGVVYGRMVGAISGNLGSSYSWEIESLTGHHIGLGACGVATLAGLVLLMIGREYSHDVKVNSAKP